jgi:hypothetical protein
MKAKRKMYENGGKTTKKYKDAKGTYVIGVNGQKIYDGVPAKKPAAAPAKTTVKATTAATKQAPPTTEGESFGRKLKEGDISGAAAQVGEAFVGMPGELYRALKRSMR